MTVGVSVCRCVCVGVSVGVSECNFSVCEVDDDG